MRLKLLEQVVARKKSYFGLHDGNEIVHIKNSCMQQLQEGEIGVYTIVTV